MSILDDILAHKRAEVAGLKRTCSQPYLEAVAAARIPPAVGFTRSLRSRPMGLIAEVKRKSPSAGVIREPFDPAALAGAYAAAGAQAISVLVDQKFFGGDEIHLHRVREAVGLPVLYKEFVVDEWQVWHAASLGAAAVLLIAAALGPADLRRLHGLCARADIEALVEVHTADEMAMAADVGAALIGINNRDLPTMRVSLETTERLAAKAPGACTLVSESGIGSPGDVRRVQAAGAHAVLVGEHLLRQPDPGRAARELMREAWGSS